MSVLEQKIEQIIEGPINGLGYNLVRVSLRGSGRMALQVMAERQDGTSLLVEDCEIISRNLSAVLDVEDPISGEYTLEVSSTGIDRPLVKLADFEKFAGKPVRVSTMLPLNGSKKFKGELVGISGHNVLLKPEEGEVMEIEFNNISSASLNIEESLFGKFEKSNQGKKKKK